MKCKQGHSREQMEQAGIMGLPQSLRGHVISQQFTRCPIDYSDVLLEVTDLNLASLKEKK